MQGWGVGWWKSSRVIGASSSCRCGLTLTPTLSQKERAIWILLLPVQFGAIGHFAGFGYPGLSRVALAVDRPQRCISLFDSRRLLRLVVASECRARALPLWDTLPTTPPGCGGRRFGAPGMTTPPGAIRESPLQEILAGVAGSGHP